MGTIAGSVVRRKQPPSHQLRSATQQTALKPSRDQTSQTCTRPISERRGGHMRRYLTPVIVLTLVGFLFGGLYRYFVDASDEQTIGYYLRSCVHGAALALSGWAVHLYFTSRSSAWVRRWPLAVELIIRSVAMAVVIATVAVGLEIVLYHLWIDAHRLAANIPLVETHWLVDSLPR